MFTMRCGCPCWFELRFYGSKLRVLVERLGAGLAAVAVNAEVLIWKLTRMDILTIRAQPSLTTRLAPAQARGAALGWLRKRCWLPKTHQYLQTG